LKRRSKGFSFAIAILLIACITLFFIWGAQNHFYETVLVDTDENPRETHLVGQIDGVFTDENYGEYEVTIYYPAINSGVSQPPDKSGAPYPAIIFAHGWLTSKELYTWIGNYCAAQGYVTLLFSVPDPTSLEAFRQSVTGITKSIDYLLVQNQGGLLSGLINTSRIGVMGHSMGAMAVLIATTEDSRIKAAVSLAPGYFGSTTKKYVEACKSIRVPIQFQAGSLDKICPPSAVETYYNAVRIPPKEIIVINGADHIQFSDAPATLWANITLEEQHETSRKYFIAWFNYYLRDDFNYYAYLFGSEARKDMENGILSSLEYVERFDC